MSPAVFKTVPLIGQLPLIPAKPAGLHHHQLPLDRDIVRFGAAH